ncbi:hypothetical protein MXD62_00020 [Frankia sp. Mgl5]|uniref:hypothetical protein n=1 Tax=Frankia sp. Mgl5 TaxID=2933793 RepID=UPI00200F861C|nr:hypothetical protein [Frankia sp. Mgl5]MCK9925564.1 hypothetical protein [Frankia sp. Mgl5]
MHRSPKILTFDVAGLKGAQMRGRSLYIAFGRTGPVDGPDPRVTQKARLQRAGDGGFGGWAEVVEGTAWSGAGQQKLDQLEPGCHRLVGVGAFCEGDLFEQGDGLVAVLRIRAVQGEAYGQERA